MSTAKYEEKLQKELADYKRYLLVAESKELEDYTTNKIENLLNLKNMDIIYTSGASESNNHVLKGICSFLLKTLPKKW